MTDNTQTQNALMPMDGFSDIDPTSSPLRGAGVKFTDGDYYAFGNEIDVEGKTYAVVDYKRGWQRLQRDCPPEYLMRELGKPMPQQPAVPKAEWPLKTTPRPHFKICGWRGSAQQQMLVDKSALVKVDTPSIAETLDDDLPGYLKSDDPAPASPPTKKKKGAKK